MFPAAYAAEVNAGDLTEQYNDLKHSYDQQARELADLKRRMQELEQHIRGMGVPTASRPRSIAQASPPPSTPGTPTPDPAADPDKLLKEPPRTRSVEAIYQQRDALFEQKFTLEPAFSYARFDRRLINLSGFLALDAIFLGTINVQQTKSDIFTFDLTGRWGVTDRLQLEANVPTIYRHSRFFSGGAGGAGTALSEATASDGGLGDISVGAHYQLYRESGRMPDVVVNARLKAPTGKDPYGIKIVQPDPSNTNLTIPQKLPTGSGVWTTSVGVSALRTVDPAIVFGNIGVIHNIARGFDDISTQVGVVTPGKVDLRNAFTWGAGLGFALNEKMSMTFGFSHLISQAARTRANGGPWTKIIGSEANAASFNFGLTYALGKATLITNLGIGLTPDAPDFAISVRLPYGL
jgi:opacity protein-like surface antigen